MKISVHVSKMSYFRRHCNELAGPQIWFINSNYSENKHVDRRQYPSSSSSL